MNQPSTLAQPEEGEPNDDSSEHEDRDSTAREPEPSASKPPTSSKRRRSYIFLSIVASTALALDLGTKYWALHTLETPTASGDGIPAPITVTSWLAFQLARNRGGAWGLLQTASESVRKPFFFAVSLVAVCFIVYLFSKVHPKQHALRWGLPLVLGGALGNLVDRVRYGWVIDFVDYKSTWVRWLNELIAKLSSTHSVTDHWPTFNVADVAICVGVGLMAIDMFTSRNVEDNESSPTPRSEGPSGKEPAHRASDTLAPTAIQSSQDSSSQDSSSEDDSTDSVAPPKQSKA